MKYMLIHDQNKASIVLTDRLDGQLWKAMTKVLKIGFILALLLIVISWGGEATLACVQGLNWGMTLDEVSTHLGGTRQLDDSATRRFSAQNVLLDRLPVSMMTFEIDHSEGLRALAYEFPVEDMSEVLSGLRTRHGQPLATSQEDTNYTEQIWVWNTGEDLITAVKRNNNEKQKFMVAYRPSRLRPEIL